MHKLRALCTRLIATPFRRALSSKAKNAYGDNLRISLLVLGSLDLTRTQQSLLFTKCQVFAAIDIPVTITDFSDGVRFGVVRFAMWIVRSFGKRRFL